MHYIQNVRSTDIAFPTGDLGGIIYYLPTSVSENKRNHQGEYPNEQIQNTVNSIAVYFSQELDLRSITKKFGTFSLFYDTAWFPLLHPGAECWSALRSWGIRTCREEQRHSQCNLKSESEFSTHDTHLECSNATLDRFHAEFQVVVGFL